MMRTVAAALAGAGLVAGSAALARVPNLAEAPGLFLALYAATFACYGVGVWLVGGARARRGLVLVLAAGLAARAVLAPAPPTLSTDAYRYVWDARVARAGLSPYAHAPEAPALAHLRDGEIYPRINHPSWPTIYPPAAQMLFGAVGFGWPDSVLAMKLVLGGFELAGLVGVLGLLRALGRPASQAVIYAWNPLILIEVWGSAHLDAVVLPTVVGAAWAAVAGRRALAGALLGAGAAVKLYPAALLPLLVGGGGLGPVAAFAAVLATGYAPGVGLGLEVLGSLPRYLAEEHFNPGLLRSLVDVPGLSVAAVAVWVLWAARRRRERSFPERAVPLVGGCLVLSPNVFPWYAVWLVPFLAAAPSWPWIGFTGTLALAYTFFMQSPWAIPLWARVGEIAPLAIGGVAVLARPSSAVSSRERTA
jgi:hypothetical protein